MAFWLDALNISALTLILAFTLLVGIARLHPLAQPRLLFALLGCLAAVRLDELLQSSGLVFDYPALLFLGSIVFLASGPVLWIYVLKRTNASQSIGKRKWHLLVVTPLVVYLAINWWPMGEQAMLETLRSGELRNWVTLYAWPLYSDSLLIGYLVASIRALNQHGLALRDWFSRIDDRNLAGLRGLITLWAACWVLHMAWIIVGPGLSRTTGEALLAALLVAHVLFIAGLIFEALAHPEPADWPDEVSASSGLKTQAEKVSGIDPKWLEQRMQEQKPYLNPNLTVAALARQLDVYTRDLSVALNQHMDKSFYQFINEWRIRDAKRMLVEQTDRNILDVAYDCGFNSKSAFNTAFKHFTGLTPSRYRKQHRS